MRNATLDPTHAKLRGSIMFRSFIVALAFATLCIFIRSVYRVAELSEGWEGSLIKNQDTFVDLEGVMVLTAVLALNAFHPGFCFREGYIRKQKQKTGTRRRRLCWSRNLQRIDQNPEKCSPVRDEGGSGSSMT